MSEEDSTHNLTRYRFTLSPLGGGGGVSLPQYQGIKKELPDLCRGVLRRARPVVNGASSFKLRHSAILTGFDSIHAYTAHAIFEYSTGGTLCQALAEETFYAEAGMVFVGESVLYTFALIPAIVFVEGMRFNCGVVFDTLEDFKP